MDMKKSVCILALAVLSLHAGAQGVNSTVQVTNDYQSRVADVNKQTMDMLVPDSLLHFDYKFDYSVFESPYKGAYEFTPYSILVSPKSEARAAHKLYLRGGAGYTLHPVLDFVWAPVSNDKCAVSIYNTGRGFIGTFSALETPLRDVAGDFKGLDISDILGAEARWALGKAEVKADVNYGFIGTGAEMDLNGFGSEGNPFITHSIKGGVGAGSIGEAPIAWSARLAGSYLLSGDMSDSKEYYGTLSGFVGMGRGAGRIKLDYLAGYYSFSQPAPPEYDTESFPIVSLTPHYDFVYRGFNISAGVKLDYTDHFSIVPDARISIGVADDAINIYAGVGGGQSICDYFSLRQNFHAAGEICPGISQEALHIFLGMDGHYGSPLRYALRFGLRNFKDAAVETLYGYTTAAFTRAYGNINLSWVDERVDADANIVVSSIVKNGGNIDMIGDSACSGNMHFTYNWNKRIYAGFFGEGRTAREGNLPPFDENPGAGPVASTFKVPGWFNLGVRGEYRPTFKLGVWVEAANLLGMDMWINPAYAQTGRIFTAGISLNL